MARSFKELFFSFLFSFLFLSLSLFLTCTPGDWGGEDGGGGVGGGGAAIFKETCFDQAVSFTFHPDESVITDWMLKTNLSILHNYYNKPFQIDARK